MKRARAYASAWRSVSGQPVKKARSEDETAGSEAAWRARWLNKWMLPACPAETTEAGSAGETNGSPPTLADSDFCLAQVDYLFGELSC